VRGSVVAGFGQRTEQAGLPLYQAASPSPSPPHRGHDEYFSRGGRHLELPPRQETFNARLHFVYTAGFMTHVTCRPTSGNRESAPEPYAR